MNDCPWGKGLRCAPDELAELLAAAGPASRSPDGPATTTECSCFPGNASVGDAGQVDDVSAQLS